MSDEYLWNKDGEGDPLTEKLEGLLGRYAHRAEPIPELEVDPPSLARPRSRVRLFATFALAAAALIAWISLVNDTSAYRVTGLTGVDRLAVGEAIATEQDQSATIEIAMIGDVTLEPNSKLSVERISDDRHLLELERGSLHAKILAPARVFQVNTPSGRAVDLGCEYDLRVTPGGDTMLSVTTGQVAFELDGRSVYVPAGASCVSSREHGPGIPIFDDARSEFRALVESLQFESDPDLQRVGELCDLVEGREEALSLYHFLLSDSLAVRTRCFERLARMFPVPPNRTAEEIMRLDSRALTEWLEIMKPYWATASVSKFDLDAEDE